MSIAIQMDIEYAKTLDDPSKRYAAFEDIAFRKKPSPAEYACAVVELGKLHIAQQDYLIAAAYFQEAAEKHPTTNDGGQALVEVGSRGHRMTSEKKAEFLYALLKQQSEHPTPFLHFYPSRVYDELVDICVATNRREFLEKTLIDFQSSKLLTVLSLTPLEQRIQELECANVGGRGTQEMFDPTCYTLIEDKTHFESSKKRVLAHIPFWLKRRKWIDMKYRKMYLFGILTAGQAFDYVDSFGPVQNRLQRQQIVSYAEAVFEYAALVTDPTKASPEIVGILRKEWGNDTFLERQLAILDPEKKWNITNPPSLGANSSPFLIVACAHLGHYAATFPKTTYERIHYCGVELMKLEQRTDIPDFWKHIYAQVLTSYVCKIIKNDGLVKL